MKSIKSFAVVIAVIFVISACGAKPVPTMSAVDVQSTAVASAFTMVAQTHEAIPTETPLPPTETPTQTQVPTDTAVVTPTLEVTFTSVPPTTNANVDPCSTRVLSAPTGRETIIRIVNTTRAAITISLYLNETASTGACGYRGYTLGGRNDVVITDLVQGCYNLWAWSNNGERVHVNASGSGCINNSDKWTFEITESAIKFTGP
jgi:hypothetical protein